MWLSQERNFMIHIENRRNIYNFQKLSATGKSKQWVAENRAISHQYFSI